MFKVSISSRNVCCTNTVGSEPNLVDIFEPKIGLLSKMGTWILPKGHALKVWCLLALMHVGMLMHNRKTGFPNKH